jgi:glycosyl transferase family 87
LLRNLKLGLLLAVLLSGSVWFYVQRIMIPQQVASAAVLGSPRGNLSDLYPRWLGARELLLRHRDPYSPEVTREIQIGYYGRSLDPARSGDPKDQQAFAYPVYVVFLIAPVIWLPFSIVHEIFRWLLVILTAITVPLWLKAFRWCPGPWGTAISMVLALGFFPIVQALKLQQLTLVVCALITGCVALLVSGQLAIAGFLLALATIKPQLVLFLTLWLILWACGDLRRRRNFLWGFGGTMVVLLAGAQLILPGWMGSFRSALIAYREYAGGAISVVSRVTTPILGLILTIVILIALALAGWRARRQTADDRAFAPVTSLILVATVVIIPMTSLYNQALLLPALLLLARDIPFVWTKNILFRSACVAAGLVLFWPWLAALALTLASFVLPAEAIQKAWSAPLWSSMVTPVVVLLLLTPLAHTVLRRER